MSRAERHRDEAEAAGVKGKERRRGQIKRREEGGDLLRRVDEKMKKRRWRGDGFSGRKRESLVRVPI